MNALMLTRALKLRKQNTFATRTRQLALLFTLVLLLFTGKTQAADNYSSSWITVSNDYCFGGIKLDLVVADEGNVVDAYFVPGNIQIKIGNDDWINWLGISHSSTGGSGGNSTDRYFDILSDQVRVYKNLPAGPINNLNMNISDVVTPVAGAGTSGRRIFKISIQQQLPASAQNQQISIRFGAGTSFYCPGGCLSYNLPDNISPITYIPTFEKPIGLNAQITCSSVTFNWSNPPLNCASGGLFKDLLYIGDEFYAQVWSSDNPSLTKTVNTLNLGQTYQAKIKREYYNSNGSVLLGVSDYSDIISFTLPPAPPTIQNFQVENNLCRMVNLTWSPLSNCDSIRILRSVYPTEPFTKFRTIGGSRTSSIDTMPQNQTSIRNEFDPYYSITLEVGGFDYSFYYKIQGKNGCGWGPETAVLSGYPKKAPTQIISKLVTLEGNDVRLRWGSKVGDATTNSSILNNPPILFHTGFRIVRASSSGQITEFVAPADAVSFLDNTVQGCETYTYNVFPVNTCAPNGYDCNYLTSGVPPANFAINYNPSVYAQYRLPVSITTQPDISSVLNANSMQASKGYFPNRVELSWSGNQLNEVDNVRLYRRVLGSPEDSVLIATVSTGTGVYSDNNTDAGTLYEYFIFAEKQCQSSLLFSNILTAVGFRSPIATINGSVTYAGGTAVEGVRISAESSSFLNGSAALGFNGSSFASIPHNPGLNPNNAVLIEAWVKPNSLTSDFILVNKLGQYEVKYVSSSNKFSFKVFTPSSSHTLLSNTGLIQSNTYSHLAFQLRNDSLQLYVNGALVNSLYTQAGMSIAPVSNPISIGSSLQGSLDEVRIWNTSKSAKEIRQDYSRYLTGGEAGLKVYLKFDERNGNAAYDMSRVSSNYNKNNATLNGTQWSTIIPTSEQLSNVAYTNNLGSYALVLPYSGPGETFNLTPSFLDHNSFNPSLRSIYVGDGSFVQNNIDFIDGSSFPVRGSVFYDGTSCPAKDIYIKVDGQIQVTPGGQPITTGTDGTFEIRVPIGQHYIEAYKEGHIYSSGRFPSAANSTYYFGGPLQLGQFYDSTLIKVVGRAVGGIREGNKKPGMGLSKNNIGKAEIIFVSENGPGCARDTVLTDSTTGEYVAYLPPLKYIVNAEIVNGAPTINFEGQDLDLTGTLSLNTVRDTTFSSTNSTIVLSTRSATYNTIQNFIHFEDPIISVTDLDGVSKFIGDTELKYVHPTTGQTLVRNLRTHPFRWPIFSSGNNDKPYKCLIKVFEPYFNVDNNKRDSVPSTNGKLYVSNQMADTYTIGADENGQNGITPYVALSEVNNLDTLKSLIYTFKADNANFNVNAPISDYNYTQLINIYVSREGQQDIEWKPITGAIPIGYDRYYRAINLGVRAIGTQYYTEGPAIVEYVLRDPPGNGSFATRETGSTTSSTCTWGWNSGGTIYASDRILSGTEFQVGTGVSTKTKFELNLVGTQSNTLTGGRNGEVSSIQTFNTTLSTNVDSDIPGPRSDLYFGRARNINVSKSDILALVTSGLSTNLDVISSAIDPYSNPSLDTTFNLVLKRGVAIIPKGYDTQFILSQAQIIETEIPALEEIRNSFFLRPNSKYQSNRQLSDEKYGKNNDDVVFGDSVSTFTPDIYEFADLDGPSYKYNYVDEEDAFTGDSVRYFNNQIKEWKEAIKTNEEEKATIDNPALRESKKADELSKLQTKYQKVIDQILAFEILNGLALTQLLPAYVQIAPGASTALGYAIYAVTSATTIAGANLAGEYAEYIQAKERIEAKYSSYAVRNFTLGGGNLYTASVTHEKASTLSNTIEYSMNVGLALEIGIDIGGTGSDFNKSLNLETSISRDWTKGTDSTETVSYTLYDSDEVDQISIDVYPSLSGWGPIFKKRAGGKTSCPYEGEDVTLIYNPGTVISEATLQHDKPTITSDHIVTGKWAKVTQVPSEQAAVFNLTIGNESETNQDRDYTVQLMSASNPYGAVARIDGVSFATITVPAGTDLNKVLTIQKGPGPVFNYDSLLFIVYPPCQFDGGVNYNDDLQDSIYISAHFIPTCTDVDLLKPDLIWVANNSNNNLLETKMTGYDINYFGFQELVLEYKPSSSSNWIPFKRFYRDTTGMNDPSLEPIPIDPNFQNATLYNWELPATDGSYDLRARTSCYNLDTVSFNSFTTEKVTPVYSGVIDRINPEPFGTPSPADGILSPEDDISIQFNEPIDLGSLTVLNFDLRGVLNGTNNRPSASLLFDGVNDYLNVTAGANLSNRDFTLQLAVKRASVGVEQALLCQGQSTANQVYLGFNAANQLVFRINNQEVVSTQTFNDSEWHNIALSYNAENETAKMYLSDAVTTLAEINSGNNSILSKYSGNNRLIIGKQDFATPNAFHGNMQELRVWDKALSTSEFTATNNTILSGSEAGLLYNWRMDEVEGAFAKDHVRNRDAVINEATWVVDPSGSAASFNGTNNTLQINQVGDVAITKEMNFTFELWFRGSGITPGVLFSNGSGNSTLADSLTSWVLKKDNAGKLHFLNDGNDFLISNENYFDGQWHHLAVVMNRDANISAIVDGNPKNSIPATPFKQFAGATMNLGAHVYRPSTTVSPITESYFTGEIDEFRFWNTNRKLEQVKRDRFNRMQGNEPGLLVYVPFESFIEDLGVAILTPGFTEQIQPTLHTLVENGTTLISETPTIKIQRPIQQVSFSYSVNNDKIIITPPSDDLERLENVTIDITVKGVKDLRGNTMESPATWIAYFNKNQVIWQNDNFNLEKAVGAPLSFSSTILNQGGAAKSFTLQNMPTWLSASPSSGIVPANSSLPVTFTIDPLVNIGDYSQDVQLLTDFNYPEKLTLNLKVRETPPNFAVNPAAFQNSMGFIGTLEISGVPSTDEEDILVAYVGNQVRGSNHLAYNASLDRYLVNLDVYSNNTSGELLKFKIWDASTGTLFSDVTPSSIVFSANELIGSPLVPQLFKTNFDIEEPLPLNLGWNWVGYYLQNSDSTNLDLLFSSMQNQVGNLVKRLEKFANYAPSSGWTGDLETPEEGIRPKYMYKFKSGQNNILMIKGKIIDPTTRTINLVTGWNWIGFVSVRNQSIGQALGNLNPLPGDQIKGRSQFAYYVNDEIGWQGSLQTLVPGMGYMYKSNQDTSFTFPYAGRFKGNVPNPKDFYLSKYKVNYGEFASNMNVIVSPNDVCENGYDANDLAIVALDENGIARGVAELQEVASNKYAFITINGEAGMNLSLYFVNRTSGEKFDEVTALAFESNALRGSIDAPELLDLSSRMCLTEDGTTTATSSASFQVYPTVFSQQFTLNFTAEEGDENAFIGLYDLTGRELTTRTMALSPGSNSLVVDLSKENLSAGSYTLVFRTNSKQNVQKLIKVN